jgi:hypothetical protein
MIQASTGPLRVIAGSTNSPTLASIAMSDNAHCQQNEATIDVCGDLCRRHRFDALALNRHQQAQAAVMHRLLPIGMTQHRVPRHRTQSAPHSPRLIPRPFL